MTPEILKTFMIAGFFITVVVFTLRKNLILSTRFLPILKIFFPSWRFFDDPGSTASLAYRLSAGQNFGPWQSCPTPVDRKWMNLFLNAQGNLHLALQTIIERLMRDVEDVDPTLTSDVSQLISYQMILKLVRLQARQSFPETSEKRVQFKISVETQGSVEEGLVSLVHEV